MRGHDNALQIRVSRTVSELRNDAVQYFKRADRKRRFANVTGQPRFVFPACEPGLQIVSRGVGGSQNLWRDEQRVAHRVARFGCAQREIEIFVGIAQTAMHHDDGALDVAMRFAQIGAGVGGHEGLAKRCFDFESIGCDDLHGPPMRGCFIVDLSPHDGACDDAGQRPHTHIPQPINAASARYRHSNLQQIRCLFCDCF